MRVMTCECVSPHHSRPPIRALRFVPSSCCEESCCPGQTSVCGENEYDCLEPNPEENPRICAGEVNCETVFGAFTIFE